MGGGNFREEKGPNGTTIRHNPDGSRETVRPGWYDRNYVTTDDGKTATEHESGGYIYRQESDGKSSWRKSN